MHVALIILAVVLLCGVLLGALVYGCHYHKYDLGYWQRQARPAQEKALCLLKVIGPLLDQVELTWWLGAGALLGWVRHNKKFIPWDDDIDLTILYDSATDQSKMQQFISLCVEQGYTVIPNTSYGFDVAKPNEVQFKLDLFMVRYNIQNPARFEFTEVFARAAWPNEQSAVADVLPLQASQFEGIPVWIPRQPRKVVAEMYGQSWEKGVVTHCHTCPWWDKVMLKIAKPFS